MSEIREVSVRQSPVTSSCLFFSPDPGMCQDATHIQDGSRPSQLAHFDTLKKYISLVSLDPVKVTIKVNHIEKAEVASLWPCAPGYTATGIVHHY